jgi:hypothetical protein
VIDYRVLVAAIAFLLVLLWRFRPELSSEDARPPVRGLDAAKTDAERVDILVTAGERYALRMGGARKASACFTRATRIAPESADLVARAARALQRHPRIVETFLWRRLGAGPWVGPERDVAKVALAALVTVYDASSRTRPRARALEQVLAALDPADPPAAPEADEPGV